MFADLALLAVLFEAMVGYPDALFRLIGHPVTWLGRLIAGCDRVWNLASSSVEERRRRGVATLLLLLAVAIGGGLLVEELCLRLLPRVAALGLLAILASSLLAQRSLHAHVLAVADALDEDGLDSGRLAVSQIVGRETRTLDEAAVCRAAIESLAENFSDGVVAPLFWLTLLGLPGALAYKAVNTADSMIGHLSDRHRAFGWAAARFDDLVNLPASRLSALLLALAAPLVAGSLRQAIAVVGRDAGRHRSPNAGWPEAAMAGALGFRLSGPRVYGGVAADEHWVGDGRAALGPADIRAALRLYRMACALAMLALAALAVLAAL